MRHFKQLTLSTLFALSAVLLLAGCGELNKKSAPGNGAPDCATQDQCKDPNQKCLSFNTKTQKGYCQATCTDTSANSTECGDGYKCVLIAGSNDKACFKKCANDKECGSGSICDPAGKVCVVQECTGASDTSCGNGRECNDSTKACQGKAPATQGPSDPQPKGCKAATECGRGPIWSCNIPSGKTRGTCETRPIVSVIIKDLGTACDGDDKGSDIVGVALLNKSGAVTGWGGSPLAWVEAGQAATNGYNNPNQPDGQPAGYQQGNKCATDKLKNGISKFTSTGCNGYLALQFPSGTSIDAGEVAVYEFDGKACGSSPATDPDDTYDVYACIDNQYTSLSNYNEIPGYLTTHCVQLNGNSGLTGYSESAYPPASTRQ